MSDDEQDLDKAFVRGYATAVVEALRWHQLGYPSASKMMSAAGITIERLRLSGVVDSDLFTLRPIFEKS